MLDYYQQYGNWLNLNDPFIQTCGDKKTNDVNREYFLKRSSFIENHKMWKHLVVNDNQFERDKKLHPKI